MDQSQANLSTGQGVAAHGKLAVFIAVLAALAIALTLQQARLLVVWRNGGFFDTDDALRMVQVRDLLAGQHWFDMTVWRLDPPQGLFMHWSRIVDVPIVALLKFFSLFLPAEAAERAARIAFPVLVFAVLLAGGAFAAKVFAGPAARVLGVFTVLFCGVMFWQFPPGRIDHHAPQITLLFFAVAAMARALDPAQARWAALSGVCIAISLGIGLENIPFFGLIAAVPGLVFIFRGAEAQKLLHAFGGGLAIALAAVFLLTVGPERWFVAACDALSPPWLLTALAGAAAYGLLSFCGRLSKGQRIVGLAVAGGAALAPMLLVWPSCLQNPYAHVDPLVKSLWLNHVGENLTLRQDFAIAPNAALLMAVPIAIGFCGALVGAVSRDGVARLRWIFLAAVIALGFAVATLSLRVFSSTMPLAALGLLAPSDALRRRLAAKGAVWANTAAFAALACMSSFAVALALPELAPPPDVETSPDMAWRRPDPCLDSASYAPLAELAPGLAVAPISAGSYILAHSGLSVLAAPYHRNDHGNRAALDILRSPPVLAESLARKAGAKYVLLCWATPADLAYYKSMGADGLAAQLSDEKIPGWLRPIEPEGATFHVYVVLPPNN